MARDDWFRKTAWTAADKEDFFAHLQRSRSKGNKAQYLRIQAGYLQGLGIEDMARETLSLLDQMLTDYPDSLERAQALLQKAQCLQFLGCLDESLTFYRASLQTEREFPRAGTGAWLDLGWVVVEHRLRNIYSEVLAVLEEFSARRLLFAIDKFRMNAIRAIIAHEAEDIDSARTFAQQALSAASEQHSGFRYHPKVGLVSASNKPIEIYKILEKLADT